MKKILFTTIMLIIVSLAQAEAKYFLKFAASRAVIGDISALCHFSWVDLKIDGKTAAIKNRDIHTNSDGVWVIKLDSKPQSFQLNNQIFKYENESSANCKYLIIETLDGLSMNAELNDEIQL